MHGDLIIDKLTHRSLNIFACFQSPVSCTIILKCSRAGASGERHGNRGHLLGGREGGEPRQGKKERQPLGRQPAGTS